MLITKYKFNNTLYDLFPEFNSGFEFTYTDEVNGEVTTRTIESDSLPTLMRFGRVWVEGEATTDNRTDSLLEVLDMNVNPTNCSSMFRHCKNMTSVNFSNFDTSNVTRMDGMFSYCTNLTDLDVSDFDTSKVTHMYYMFYGCSSLTTLDVSGFDTSKVTRANNMFYDCSSLTSLTFGQNCTFEKVTDMQHMFYGCNSLTVIDGLEYFNTENVTNMTNMFYNCNNLTTLDVSNWNVSKVTTMNQMFRLCGQLIELDVGNWNTSKVEDMYSMFNSCLSLISLNVSNWDTSSLISAPELFYNCSKLTSLDLSKWNTSNVVGMGYMFGNCSSLTTLDVSNWNIDKVNNFTDILAGANSLKYVKCNNFLLVNELSKHLPTKVSTQGTIICKSNITNLDTTALQSKNWTVDTSDGTMIAKYKFDKSIYNSLIPEFNSGFSGYFCNDVIEDNIITREIVGYGGLPTLMRFGTLVADQNIYVPEVHSLLEILDMNTSALETMRLMFHRCYNVSKIDCVWNTSKVTDMYAMLSNCHNLTSLDLSNFNTNKVTNMAYMFYSCIKLTSLDVSNFDTSKVTDMEAMFYNCNKLTTLDLSNFDTSKATNISGMFRDSFLLKDIGMIYCNASTIQKIINAIPTDLNKTLWYKEANIDNITYSNNIALKKYIEENIKIVLNSPLLKGDTIEVVDGKLCHVHKMGMVVLDGSESWTIRFNNTNPYGYALYFLRKTGINNIKLGGFCISDTIKCQGFNNSIVQEPLLCLSSGEQNNFAISSSVTQTNSFKQWLQANPIVVTYELAEPYYEDITPLQSSIALRTFEECNVQVITALPIKTKITYRTNITSAVVLEQELDTLDSGVSLSNLIEEEVDE